MDRLEAVVAISISGNAVYFQANNDAIKEIMEELAKIKDKLMPYQTRQSGVQIIH